MGIITGVVLTPLKVYKDSLGGILHAIKNSDATFNGFGEAYFSIVHYNTVKGWKKHREMLLNIIVPQGKIKFVLFDDRKGSNTFQEIMEVELCINNYQRLTVPPGIWMAFKGMNEGENMLLNIANIPHDPTEADNLPLHNEIIPYRF